MTHRRTYLPLRFWIAATLAALFAVTTCLTLWQPTWIEAIFGADPDRGSGSTEWTLALTLGAATLLLAVLARREWARPRAA
jgi:hypothetical protein